MRVVLDTNIFVSAAITPGVGRDFVLRLLSSDIEIVMSDYIMAEADEVLARHKFENKKIKKRLWEQIKGNTIFVRVAPVVSEKIDVRDPKDHPILQTAKMGKAAYIITGDEDLLVLEEWQGIKITSMKNFWSKIL